MSRSSGGRARVAVTGVGIAISGLAIWFVVATLVDQWGEVSEQIADAQLAWLGLGFVLAAGAMVWIAWCWRFVLEDLGVEVPATRVLPWYFLGEITKYVPGGVWPVIGRGELARRGGVPRPRAYASVAMSLGTLYLSAMFVAVAFLPFAVSGGGFSAWMLTLLALPVGVVALHPTVLGAVARLADRVTRRDLDILIPSWRSSLLLVARFVPAWLMVGGATYAVARSLTDDVGVAQMVFASVLSWVVGFAIVLVPSGAGVREAVLLAAAGTTPGVAATTAVAARILFVVVDVIGALVSAPLLRRMGIADRAGEPADDIEVDPLPPDVADLTGPPHR